MKNVSKRNRIILAIVGVLAVVVVTVGILLVANPVSKRSLFGEVELPVCDPATGENCGTDSSSSSSTSSQSSSSSSRSSSQSSSTSSSSTSSSRLVITPSNPTISVGAQQKLDVNATYNCVWSSSNTNIVSFVGDATEVKSVTVKGIAAGSAVITAKCGLGAINVNQVTTNVTVR